MNQGISKSSADFPIWAASAPREAGDEIAALRTVPGLLVSKDSIHWWIIGDASARELSAGLKQSLQSISGARLFQVRPDCSLVPLACLVPTGKLPDGPWLPLWECIVPQLPLPGFASCCRVSCGVALVRSPSAHESTVLELQLADWVEYVGLAPRIRLDRLEFAVANDARVLVRGTPLPPIPGIRYCDHDGILIPAGWSWTPAIEPQILRQVLGILPAECALGLPATQSWERLPADAFVPAQRQHVRQTWQALASIPTEGRS